MIDIEELERLARAATPGPWEQRPGERFLVRRRGGRAVVIERYVLENGELDKAYPAELADSAYVAAANPQTILALVAELRAARAVCEGLTDEAARLSGLSGALSAWRRAGGGK